MSVEDPSWTESYSCAMRVMAGHLEPSLTGQPFSIRRSWSIVICFHLHGEVEMVMLDLDQDLNQLTREMQ